MSDFFCENKDCEEHKTLGTDDEWMGLWDKLFHLDRTRNFFIVSKDCLSPVGDEFAKIGETENLIAYRLERNYERGA